MNYRFFGDPEYAGPGPLDLVCFYDRTPRQLRPLPRKNFQKFTHNGHEIKSQIATKNDAVAIMKLWNDFYSGPDWKFQCSLLDVERWMKHSIIILAFDESEGTKQLVATFVARLLPNGLFSGALNKQAGILEGLVIHPRLRGQGLTNFLLAEMDRVIYSRPETHQAFFVWFREHTFSLSAIPQIPVAVHEYGYIKISDIPKPNPMNRATPAAKMLVEEVVFHIYESERANLTILSHDTSDPDVYWFLANSSLIGIADTHRYTTAGNHVMWEVVFACNLFPPHFDNLLESIEKAARELPTQNGIIFISSSKTRGNMNAHIQGRWSFGKSGCISTHIYNWMPPCLISGDTLFPHSCI